MPDAQRDGNLRAVVAATLGLLLAVLVGVVVLVRVMERVRNVGAQPSLTASPLAAADTAADQSLSVESNLASQRDVEAREFAASLRVPHAEDVRSAVADLDGDGQPEIVVVSRVNRIVRVDVGDRSERTYAVVLAGVGGGADRIDDFALADVTGDDVPEIITRQSIGTEGESVSIWGFDGERFIPLTAQGGCWDGSHTFGVTGAEVSTARIVATCDGAGPPERWPSDVYVWDGGWIHQETIQP